MTIDLSQFRETFFVEAAEHLEAMEGALLQLESRPDDRELLNTIFRAAHTIKGASGTFGMDEVGRFTHVLESLLDRLRDGGLTVTDHLVELLLTSTDVIQGLIAAVKDGVPAPENTDAVLGALHAANEHHGAPSQPTSSHSVASRQPVIDSNASCDYCIQLVPCREFFRFGQEPLLLIRELGSLGTLSDVTVDASRLPDLDSLDSEDCYLGWKLRLRTSRSLSDIQDVFMFLDDQSQLSITEASIEADESADIKKQEPVRTNSASKVSCEDKPLSPKNDAIQAAEPVAEPVETKSTSKAKSSTPADATPTKRATGRSAAQGDNETVRVDRRRLDELINQIGELVIGVSMVEREVASVNHGGESAAMMQLAKIVRDLQELSLSLRMVPIAAAFQKMARVVHDIGRKLNKQIDFVTEGDDTELDKSVVDKIGDPLIHMVRNAVDHGVETPDVRIARGKPAAGRVSLRAYQQGGNIFIELTDDGQGLNRKAILAKAKERGLIGENDSLSDADICNLIFQPGFSTAKEITDVSGRGVGMDVVRRNVEDLQGSVQVRSIEGQGSTITVRLPLTLAILDGLLVRVTSEVYVIPLLSVVESISVGPKEIRQLIGTGEVIMLRGEIVPVISLQGLLQSSSNDCEDRQDCWSLSKTKGDEWRWLSTS